MESDNNDRDMNSNVPTGRFGDALDAVITRVIELGAACTFDQAREVVRDAVRSGLPGSALDHMVEIFADMERFSPGTIRSMIKEARNTCDEYGELHTLGEVARAVNEMLERDYEAAVWVGDALYVYSSLSDAGVEDEAERGYHSRVSSSELDATLQSSFRHLTYLERESARKEVVKLIATQRRNDTYFEDAHPGVCVQNGFLTVDEDGRLRLLPHDVEQKSRVKLPFRFDADAPTDWIRQGFAKVLQDPTKLLFLQEAFSATMFNMRVRKDNVRRMFTMYGARRSGKSTVLAILKELFPEEAVTSVPPNEWGREYSRAQLDGKLLNLVTELGSDMRLPAAQLKKIVSCEPVTARHPYGRQFNLVPAAWHWFATNELPRVSDKTDAFERRIGVIAFERPLEDHEVDPLFVERILADPSGLFNWVAEGAARLQRNGKFTTPNGHAEACARMQHGDNIAAILATRIERAPGARITTAELRWAAASLADELGMEEAVIDSGMLKSIAQQLYARFGAERRMAAGRPFYEHVRFKANAVSQDAGTNDEGVAEDRVDEVELEDL